MEKRVSRFRGKPSYLDLLLDMSTNGYVFDRDRTPLNFLFPRFTFLNDTVFESRLVLLLAMVFGTLMLLYASVKIEYLSTTFADWRLSSIVWVLLALILGLLLDVFAFSRWQKINVKK